MCKIFTIGLVRPIPFNEGHKDTCRKCITTGRGHPEIHILYSKSVVQKGVLEGTKYLFIGPSIGTAMVDMTISIQLIGNTLVSNLFVKAKCDKCEQILVANSTRIEKTELFCIV